MLGKLYVFEGADGAGKSTLSKRFAGYLQSAGVVCEYRAFPGNEAGTLGRHIYELHHDPARFGIHSITATSLQLLHIAAHIDAIDSCILPKLNEGISVVLDRFWWSTWVYGVVSGANLESLREMIRLELLHWKQFQPEIIFLILRELRTTDNAATTDTSLATIYRELAEEEGRRNSVCIIENNSSLQEALSRIQSAAKLGLQ